MIRVSLLADQDAPDRCSVALVSSWGRRAWSGAVAVGGVGLEGIDLEGLGLVGCVCGRAAWSFLAVVAVPAGGGAEGGCPDGDCGGDAGVGRAAPPMARRRRALWRRPGGALCGAVRRGAPEVPVARCHPGRIRRPRRRPRSPLPAGPASWPGPCPGSPMAPRTGVISAMAEPGRFPRRHPVDSYAGSRRRASENRAADRKGQPMSKAGPSCSAQPLLPHRRRTVSTGKAAARQSRARSRKYQVKGLIARRRSGLLTVWSVVGTRDLALARGMGRSTDRGRVWRRPQPGAPALAPHPPSSPSQGYPFWPSLASG